MPNTALTAAADPYLRSLQTAIRVFIAEDHNITLWGLERLVEGALRRMEVVGTASSRASLMADPALADADVVIMDLELDGEDCADVVHTVQQRCAGHVLIVTASDDNQRQRQAIMNGARGIVHKSEDAATILQAIEKLHRGEVWVPGRLLGDVLGQLTGQAPAAAAPSEHQRRIASLTVRERQIVKTLTNNSGAKLISVAEDLHLSENTLRNHLTTIYSKLGVRGRLELHVFATANGISID